MKKIKKGFGRIREEFDLAWKEFFKDKPKPKTEKEEKKQFEDFIYWYNNIRKQTDTGKTPNEMYKIIYGKESAKNSIETSRMMNFEWDENYKEPGELLYEADQLIIKGKFKEAMKRADEFLEICPDEPEGLLLKAQIFAHLDNYKNAKMYIEKSRKIDPQNPHISFTESIISFQQGKIKETIEHIKKAYKKDPDNFDFVMSMAQNLFLDHNKNYKKYLNKAKRIDKKRTENFLKHYWLEESPFLQLNILNSLSNIDKLIKENKPEEALKELKIIKELDIDEKIKEVVFGFEIECLIITKKLEQAELAIENLLKINKNNPHAYLYKTQTMIEENNIEEALTTINECIKTAEKNDLKHPDYYFLKSIILKKQGNEEYKTWEEKAKRVREKNLDKLKKEGLKFKQDKNGFIDLE